MKKTQLFDLLGEIDNKFLDEAVGADSEKPLKIDTGRNSVRWYHIAAPIAACLVLGAGVAVSMYFRSRPVPVGPGSQGSGSESGSTSTNVTISDPPKDPNSDPIVLEPPEEKIDYYGKFPIFAPENIPTLTNTHGEIDEKDVVNATLSVTELGEYDVCISAETVFFLEGEPDIVYAAGVYMSLVKDGKQISSDGFSWISPVTSGRACYAFDKDISNISVEILELTDAHVAAVRYNKATTDEFGTECELLSIKDDKISRIWGTDVTGSSPTTVSFSETLIPIGNSIVDIGKNREYVCNVDAFNNNPYETPHFTTRFCNVKGEVVTQLSKKYPDKTESHNTTLSDLENWKDFTKNANIFFIEVYLQPEMSRSGMYLSPELSSAILDMIASAELETTDDPKDLIPAAGGGILVDMYDVQNNCLASIDIGTSLRVDYGNSGDRYVFNLKDRNNENDLYSKLMDIIPYEEETMEFIVSKQFKDYTFSAFAAHVTRGENVDEVYGGEWYIKVERNGSDIANIKKDLLPEGYPLVTSSFDNVVITFEMKDGVGFAICPIRKEHPELKTATFYKLDGDNVTALFSPTDYAPIIGMGTEMYIGTDPQIVPEENAIVTDDGNKLVIDFQNNRISVVEN